MARVSKYLLFVVLWTMPSPVHAQGEERMDASVTLDAKEAVAGGTFKVKVKLDVKPGFHTYPVKQNDPKVESIVTTIRVKDAKTASVEQAGEITGPAPKEKLDTQLGATVGYYEETVELEVPLKVKAGTAVGPIKFTLALVTQACDDNGCVPFTKNFDLQLTVKEGKPPPPPKASGPEETFWSFTLTGIGFGFLMLLTPCVFPMIPITVSFFLKQEASGHKALINALVYTLTIVIAMTVIAYAFIEVFQALIQDWTTNMVLAILFVYFALSLFGMYEITLPGFLTRWTAAGEAKGGYIGTIFMAMTFTLISFSCVAPFLGGFAGATAGERPVLWNIVGALGFALAFASPFFIIALFPTLLKRMPKSGNWLNNMKVVMGFLEIAAALKFFRTAELRYTGADPSIFTYDLVLGAYVALCLLAGLYLIGLFQMPHDEGDPRKVGVGRLMWSCFFLGLGFYLVPGLFRAPDGTKLRPAGTVFAWVDSFLLDGADTAPLPMGPVGSATNSSQATKWIAFLEKGLQQARDKKQRVFIDFTGTI